MKFAITNDHHHLFREERALLFEEFLFEEQHTAFKVEVEAVLAHRLGEKWKLLDHDELFVEGYDLHAESDVLRRLLSQRRLASIVAELLDCRPLRLGFDQYLPCNPKRKSGEDPYGEFLRQEISLKEISSVQGIRGGLLFCLESPEREDPKGIFPSIPGQAVLVRADKPIAFSFLDGQSRGSYFLATYTEEISLYVRNDSDPHLHALKRWGYIFGDKLKEPHHPIIFR